MTTLVTRNLLSQAIPQNDQFRLAKSGSSLLLSPFNGNLIMINSKIETIPDAGVSLAVTGLSNTTLYRVYAYMNGATMTLEASTTARATQAGTGIQVKSGDVTRTFVGLCYLVSGAFVDSVTQRFVRSWANDPKAGMTQTGIAGTTTSSSYAEISSSKRCEYLAFAGETGVATFDGYGTVASASAAYRSTKIYINGASVGVDSQQGYTEGQAYSTNSNNGINVHTSDEYQYFSVYLSNSNNSTSVSLTDGSLSVSII